MGTNMIQETATKDIEDRLFSMLSSQLRIPREGLTRDSTLESIGLDSLATIEFIFQVEDSFGIHFDEEGAPPKTLGEVFDQIAACMNKSAGHE
jgi:acyl carrier protein